MVCSTCGYENQVGNRFCGMCGTPLPHRPLTAPGAQSTASLTRVLTENGRPIEPNGSAAPVARVSLDIEPGSPRDQQTLSETSSNAAEVTSEPPPSVNLTPPSRDSSSKTLRSKTEPPQFDLVPEIPLDEYVQNFRYVPPSEPDETSMRGETQVLEPEVPAPSNTTSVTSVDTAIPSAEATPPPAAEAPPTPAEDDVRERLGLEVESDAEQRSDRPRFLDFNDPPTPPKPVESATPIAGPSFLGLTDVPPVEAEAELSAEEPARGRWRIWLATAAVLVFGFLGVLEWRAQLRQTNNGPIEVIKMKMRSLNHGKPAENANTESASPATASDSASKPEIQVEPPSQPQQQNSTGSSATPAIPKDVASAPNTSAETTPLTGSTTVMPAPTGNQAAPGQSTSTPMQNPSQPSAGQNAPAAKTATTTGPVDKSKLTASQQSGSAATTAADKAKASPRVAGDSGDVVPKKGILGAEEMAKANNASDSAAEVAWLWKATAKGNPDAPVRLADMYVKGNGVPRSCEQAMVLLKTAATKENALARNRLASMYGSGTCVPRDRVEAYRWLSSALAANPNSEWARQNRDLLWHQMTPEERGAIQPPH